MIITFVRDKTAALPPPPATTHHLCRRMLTLSMKFD
jgi:hypothetical protein